MRQETLALTSLDAFVREFVRLLGDDGVARVTDAKERRSALLDALRGRRALLIWDNLETLTAEERDLIAEFLRRLPGAQQGHRHQPAPHRRKRGHHPAGPAGRRRRAGADGRFGQAVSHTGDPTDGCRHSVPTRPLRGQRRQSAGNPLDAGAGGAKGPHRGAGGGRLQDAGRSADLYGFLFAERCAIWRPATKRCSPRSPRSRPPRQPARWPMRPTCSPSGQHRAGAAGDPLAGDRSGRDRYGLHPLTRAYVATALAVPMMTTTAPVAPTAPAAAAGISLNPAARREALRYWVDYARKYGGAGKDAYQTYDRLDAEWPNLESAAAGLYELTGRPGALTDREATGMLNDLATALCGATGPLFFRGFWNESVRLAGWAYDATAALGDWESRLARLRRGLDPLPPRRNRSHIRLG